MRYKRKVPRHVEERVVDTRTVCDSCGKRSDRGDGYSEVTVEAKLGHCYPEFDCRILYEIDICGECFESKVMPALDAVGLRFRRRHAEDYYCDDGRVWDPEVES